MHFPPRVKVRVKVGVKDLWHRVVGLRGAETGLNPEFNRDTPVTVHKSDPPCRLRMNDLRCLSVSAFRQPEAHCLNV